MKYKKMGFLVPIYNADKHIKKNLDMWKKLSQISDIYFVEDSLNGDCEAIAKKIGVSYYKKQNGNWGSVINFAVKNKIIKNEYMAILDPDDLINIFELKKLIKEFDYSKDIYISRFTYMDDVTKKTKIKKTFFDKWTFIHQIWFKKEIFYKLNILPEKISYTDNLVVLSILENSNTKFISKTFPYIYKQNIKGQSTQIDLNKLNSAIKQSEILLEALPKIKSLKNFYRKKITFNNIKYHDLLLIREAFDKANKVDKKKIRKIYKKRSKILKPIRYWKIWSEIYFLFKGAK